MALANAPHAHEQIDVRRWREALRKRRGFVLAYESGLDMLSIILDHTEASECIIDEDGIVYRISLDGNELVAVEFEDCDELAARKYPEIRRLYDLRASLRGIDVVQSVVVPSGDAVQATLDAAKRTLSLALAAAQDEDRPRGA